MLTFYKLETDGTMSTLQTNDSVAAIAAGYSAEKPSEFTTKENELAVAEIRNQRNDLLDRSDWTQMADAPLTESKKTEWATYRQALRDITDQSGYPDSVTWPTKPTGE